MPGKGGGAVVFGFPLLAAVALADDASLRPTLALRDLAGREQNLEAHRGHVMVINFWATWCLPCKEELPLLAAMQHKFASRGVMFLGAAGDPAAERGKVSRMVREMKVPYPVWTGATTADMARFGLQGTLPATVILDREGLVAGRIEGMVQAADLESRLERVLAEAPAAAAHLHSPALTKRVTGAALVPS
jgi:thiol-disulfide isomerase/thioredoxin